MIYTLINKKEWFLIVWLKIYYNAILSCILHPMTYHLIRNKNSIIHKFDLRCFSIDQNLKNMNALQFQDLTFHHLVVIRSNSRNVYDNCTWVWDVNFIHTKWYVYCPFLSSSIKVNCNTWLNNKLDTKSRVFIWLIILNDDAL